LETKTRLGMGFLMGVNIFHGYGFGIAKPDGFVPVAISRHVQGCWALTCGPRNITDVILGATNAGRQCNLLAPWYPQRMPQHERTACHRNGQARCLHDDLVADRQQSGHGSFNAEATHRLPVEWIWLIKCRGGTSPASGVDRQRGLSAINAEAARPRGLTSGSARRLTSRVVGHVAASGLCLSGEQKRTRYGPDTCRPRTSAWS
jgi:hypothetical protein